MARTYKTRTAVDQDFKVEAVVEGVVSAIDHFMDGDQERRFLLIDTGSSLRRVYQSKALDDVFAQVVVGDGVRIEYKGEKALDGGKRFHIYDAALWSE